MCLLSVVMSVYNCDLFLKESIDSILIQTLKDFELIIINDGSIDSSSEIVRSYNDSRIVFIEQENKGLATALNVGINSSKSEYIVRMDADDICFPERFQIQFDFMKKNPECVIVGSNAEVIDMEGRFVYNTNLPIADSDLKKWLPKTPFIHPSVMFRKSAFIQAGRYPEYMLVAQDLVLFNRMAKYGKIANLKESLIKYRITPTANSTRDDKTNERYNSIIEKATTFDSISENDTLFLKSQNKNRLSEDRYANYHLYLAKKYLWNNHKPSNARANLIKSFKYKPNISLFFYYAMSFLPKSLVINIHKKLR